MLLAVVECCLLPLGYKWDRFDAQHFRDSGILLNHYVEKML